ncbi:MAG: orotate phosphoribosyltransferase [Candidatus Bathyarchaeia archaeon]
MEEKTVVEEICKILQKTNALEFGAFKLSSGKTTPYYVDLRVIPSFPDAFQRIMDIMTDTITDELDINAINRIAGIPISGTPFAALLAFRLKKPYLYTRQTLRLRGRERRVEGVLIPGDRVLLVDDLATTGQSLLKAATAIRAEGGLVSDAFVLLDREEGATERLAGKGITLHRVLGMGEVARNLYELSVIDEEQLDIILKQIK